MALFSNIVQLSSQAIKKNCLQLGMMQDFIKGTYLSNKPCPNCYAIYRNQDRHINTCYKVSFGSRKLIVLTLDGKSFMCQFGCPIKTNNVNGIFQHFLDSHSGKELEQWGINRRILIEGLPNSGHQTVPASANTTRYPFIK